MDTKYSLRSTLRLSSHDTYRYSKYHVFNGQKMLRTSVGGQNKATFTQDRDEVNPGRSRFGHSIIIFYLIYIHKRCLHEAGMKNAQTGLKSSRLLDRADYLQTGTNPERDKCEHKYSSDWSQLRSLLRNNACSTKPVKNNNGSQEK